MSKHKDIKPTPADDAGDGLTVEQSFSQAAVDAEPTEATTEAAETTPQTEEEKLRAKVAELEDRLLRSMAEFDNYRKRTARQFDEISRSATDKLFGDLLDVVANLDRALEHCKEGSDLASLRQGMEMIHGQFMGLLTRYDIHPIEAIGQPFDPNFHSALMQIDSAEYPENVVAAEIGKGFMQGDRVLRHTQVAVSRGNNKAGDSNTKDDK
jgi:molecular chaperone GrpE